MSPASSKQGVHGVEGRMKQLTEADAVLAKAESFAEKLFSTPAGKKVAARWPSALELESKGISLARQFALHVLSRRTSVRNASQTPLPLPAPAGLKASLSQMIIGNGTEKAQRAEEGDGTVKALKADNSTSQMPGASSKVTYVNGDRWCYKDKDRTCYEIGTLGRWAGYSDRFLPDQLCKVGSTTNEKNNWVLFHKRKSYYTPYWYQFTTFGGSKQGLRAPLVRGFLKTDSVLLRGCCQYSQNGFSPVTNDRIDGNNLRVDRCTNQEEWKAMQEEAARQAQKLKESQARAAVEKTKSIQDPGPSIDDNSTTASNQSESANTCHMIDLQISGFKLKKMGLFSQADPVVTVSTSKLAGYSWYNKKIIGRTEIIDNNANPVFSTTIPVEFTEADPIFLWLLVEDANQDLVALEDAEFIGEVHFALNKYMKDHGGRVTLKLKGLVPSEDVGSVQVSFIKWRPCPEEDIGAKQICYDPKGFIDVWTGKVKEGSVRPSCERIGDLPKWAGTGPHYIQQPICGDSESWVWLKKDYDTEQYSGLLSGRTGLRNGMDVSIFTDEDVALKKYDAARLGGCCEQVDGKWQPILKGPGALHVKRCSKEVEFSITQTQRLGMLIDYEDSVRSDHTLRSPVRISEMAVGTMGWRAGVRSADYLMAFKRGSNGDVKYLTNGTVTHDDVEGALVWRPATFTVNHMLVPKKNEILEVFVEDPSADLGITYARQSHIGSGNKWTVASVLPGTPAWEAGVRYGDEIRVMNHDTRGITSTSDMRHNADVRPLTAKIKVMSNPTDLEEKLKYSEEFMVTGEDITKLGLSLDLSGSTNWQGYLTKPMHVLSVSGDARDEVKNAEIRTGDVILELNRRPLETMTKQDFMNIWDDVRPLHIRHSRAHQMTSAAGVLRVYKFKEADATRAYTVLKDALQNNRSSNVSVIASGEPKSSTKTKVLLKLFENVIALDVKFKDTFEQIVREELVQFLSSEVHADEDGSLDLEEDMTSSFSAFSKELSEGEAECETGTKEKVKASNMKSDLANTPELMANFDHLPEQEQAQQLMKSLAQADAGLETVGGNAAEIESLLEIEVAKLQEEAEKAIQSVETEKLSESLKSALRAGCEKKRNKEAGGLKKLLKQAKDEQKKVAQAEAHGAAKGAVEYAQAEQETEYWPTLANRGSAIQASIFHTGIEEVVDFRNWEIGVFHFMGMQVGPSAVGFGAGGYTGIGWKGYKLDWDLQAAYQTAIWESTGVSLPGGFAGLGGVVAIDADNSAGNMRLWTPDLKGAKGMAFGYAFGLSAYSGAVAVDVGQSLYRLMVTECFDSFTAFIKAIWRPWCGSCKRGSGLGTVDAMKAWIHLVSWPIITEVLFTTLAFIQKGRHAPNRCSPMSTRHLNDPSKLILAIDLRLQEAAGRLETFELLVHSLELAVQGMDQPGGNIKKIEAGLLYEAMSADHKWFVVKILAEHKDAEGHTFYSAEVRDENGNAISKWDKVFPEHIRKAQMVSSQQITSMVHSIHKLTCLREPMVIAKKDGIGCMVDDECPATQVCFGNRCICEESACNVPGHENNNFGTCMSSSLMDDNRVSQGAKTKDELDTALTYMRSWVASMKVVLGNLAVSLSEKVDIDDAKLKSL